MTGRHCYSAPLNWEQAVYEATYRSTGNRLYMKRRTLLPSYAEDSSGSRQTEIHTFRSGLDILWGERVVCRRSLTILRQAVRRHIW